MPSSSTPFVCSCFLFLLSSFRMSLHSFLSFFPFSPSLSSDWQETRFIITRRHWFLVVTCTKESEVFWERRSPSMAFLPLSINSELVRRPIFLVISPPCSLPFRARPLRSLLVASFFVLVLIGFVDELCVCFQENMATISRDKVSHFDHVLAMLGEHLSQKTSANECADVSSANTVFGVSFHPFLPLPFSLRVFTLRSRVKHSQKVWSLRVSFMKFFLTSFPYLMEGSFLHFRLFSPLPLIHFSYMPNLYRALLWQGSLGAPTPISLFFFLSIFFSHR